MNDYSSNEENALDEALDRQAEERGQKPAPRVPPWMWAVLAVSVLPGVIFPWTLSLIHTASPMLRGLTWFYPLYVLLSAFLAWQCYGRRTLMSWIIVVLLWLTHLCFYYLTFVAI